MGSSFYGGALEEHYEKDLKKFRARDWVMLVIVGALVLSAILSGILSHWGIMVVLIGVVCCLSNVLVRVVFDKKSKLTFVFVSLGILAIIAGIIIEAEMWEAFQYYVVFIFMLISFAVTAICFGIKIRNSRKIKMYSLEVVASSEMVDVRNINLFKFDDRPHSNYTSPINDNTLYKPGFHYVVNGQEYFTPSEIYYGDLNKGFVEGNNVHLKVNPDNPTEILPVDADSSLANMAMVMGICWLLAGIGGIVVMILMAGGVISFL